jgi:hypothetical protein
MPNHHSSSGAAAAPRSPCALVLKSSYRGLFALSAFHRADLGDPFSEAVVGRRCRRSKGQFDDKGRSASQPVPNPTPAAVCPHVLCDQGQP